MHASVMTRARGVRTPGSLHMDDRLKAKAEHERLMVALAAHDARRAAEVLPARSWNRAFDRAVAPIDSARIPGTAPLIANEA